MKGTKWLSEAVHEEALQAGALNLVKAPTGCGKTYWAAHFLVRRASNKNRMVYLIDTAAARDQLLQDESLFAFYDREWRTGVQDELLDFVDNRIVVMTYAKFGALTTYFPELKERFEVIVCDEIHNLPAFTAIPNEGENYHQKATDALEEIVKYTKTLVIALTATPREVEAHFRGPVRHIPVESDLRQYEVKNVWKFRGWKALLLCIDSKQKGLFFTTHIRQVREIAEFANANGFRAMGLWGKSEPMNEEQQRVRDWLTEKRTMPPEYDLLVLNAAYETSITIDGVSYVVVKYQDGTRITQACGRVRGDLDALYLYTPDAPVEVPPSYLNRPLSPEERATLADILDLEKGMKWTGTQKRLQEMGYIIENMRIKDKRYRIIYKDCQNPDSL